MPEGVVGRPVIPLGARGLVQQSSAQMGPSAKDASATSPGTTTGETGGGRGRRTEMENETARRGLVVVESVGFASGSRDATLGPRSLVRAMRPSTKACGSRRRLKRQPSSACLALVIGPNSNSILRPKSAPCRPKIQSNYQIRFNNKKTASPATGHLSDIFLRCACLMRCNISIFTDQLLWFGINSPSGWSTRLVHVLHATFVHLLFTLSNHRSPNHCLTISYHLRTFDLSCSDYSPSLDSLFCFHACSHRLS